MLDDAVDRSQPQPGASPWLLGGKKRLKQTSLGCCIHPDAGVVDREQDVLAGARQRLGLQFSWIELDVCRLNRDATALRHGVPRIHDQVHDRLLQLPRIGVHHLQLGCESCLQLDVFPNQPHQHPLKISHKGVEVEDARLEHLFATEDEELTGESSRALGGLLDFLDVQACL